MMALNTSTANLRAIERTNEAMAFVRMFLERREQRDIEAASKQIDQALQADCDYTMAVYFKGVIDDLAGRAADAEQHFERIIEHTSKEDVEHVQALYSMGVAYYHRYSHRWLEKAEECFREVINLAKPDDPITQQTQAMQAQTHAMWIRPPVGTDTASSDFQQHMRNHYDVVMKLRQEIGDIETLPDNVAGTNANAVGAANMYITDYLFTACDEQAKCLRIAHEYLIGIVQRKLPRDWAGWCNIGSCWLRLGALSRRCPEHAIGDFKDVDTCFRKSKEALEYVINKLRPNYGFALHELGRLHRYWEKFPEAIKYQDRAIEIPERYRDISDEGVQRERSWAEQERSDYPEPQGERIAGGA